MHAQSIGAFLLSGALCLGGPAAAQDSWTEDTLIEALAGPLTRSLTGCDRDTAVDPDMVEEASLRRANLAVEFAFGSARVKPDGVVALLGKSLSNPRLACHDFLLAGHTDAVGSDAANLALSEARAAALRAYLVETYGIEPERLVTRGYGENRLKSPEIPDAAENRRVEIITLTTRKAN